MNHEVPLIWFSMTPPGASRGAGGLAWPDDLA